jgi:hypothetical protein
VIPGATPVIAAPTLFQPPLNLPYDALRQVVWGGTALNDGQNGRKVQYWEGRYQGGNIEISLPGQSVVFSHPAPGARSISIAFDQNMAPVLNWQTETEAFIYFFVPSAYQTLSVPASSSRIAVDDLRDFNAVGSDIIFTYTFEDILYYRQQRENYAVQRTIGPAEGREIRKVGLSVINRLQLELDRD